MRPQLDARLPPAPVLGPASWEAGRLEEAVELLLPG